MATLLIDRSLADFTARASEAAGMLKALANEKRLMILCKLLEHGEMSVMALCDEVGLGQSALSQHLARMRDENIVGFFTPQRLYEFRHQGSVAGGLA